MVRLRMRAMIARLENLMVPSHVNVATLVISASQCNRPVVHIGQDECIFKQHSESCKEWTVHGQGKLHSKTDGKGEMVSGFQDSFRGSGRPTSAR